MDHVKSTIRLAGGAAGSSGENRGSEGSVDIIEYAVLTDMSSHNGAGGGADDGSHVRNYFFGPSTVTVSRIHGMIDHGYFAKGMDRVPAEEVVPEPQPDEAVVFEEFFSAGLRMPPHLVLADILLKFQAQLHQLTANAMVQLSKYILAVMSFGGVLLADGFAKRYGLHFQPRKIEVDGAKVQGQYGCLNFHAKCGGQRAKLTVAVKNKWSMLGLKQGVTVKFPCFDSGALGGARV
jgi:hypothetical protein